jgi:dinuclear metal center YbgI/SA1388 family protein
MPRAPSPVSRTLRTFVSDFESRIASLNLAEHWDNVGMLIECPSAHRLHGLRVLACIDLTDAVVSEAIQKQCNLVLSYHPVLFRATHSLSLSHQLPIIRCIESGINVFSPHTALDTAQGGMNDYLCDFFGEFEGTRAGIKTDPVTGASSGRVSTLKTPLSLESVIGTLKSALNLQQIRYASVNDDPSRVKVRSIAVCVGSGGSLLGGVDADVLLTGEMSHHEILAAISKGRSVILLDHSSSERPFLPELARRVSELSNVEFVCVSEVDKEPIKLA